MPSYIFHIRKYFSRRSQRPPRETFAISIYWKKKDHSAIFPRSIVIVNESACCILFIFKINFLSAGASNNPMLLYFPLATDHNWYCCPCGSTARFFMTRYTLEEVESQNTVIDPGNPFCMILIYQCFFSHFLISVPWIYHEVIVLPAGCFAGTGYPFLFQR